MLSLTTALDKIPISYQPMLKLITNYGLHELFLHYYLIRATAETSSVSEHLTFSLSVI